MSDVDNWDSVEPSGSVQYQPPPQQSYGQTFFRNLPINPDDILMDIESRFAGMIIGKGGVKIKSLKQESGAFISIIDGDSYGYKTVKISGSSKAKKLAQKMISDIINADNPRKNCQKSQEAEPSKSVQSIPDFYWVNLLKEQKEKLAALPPIIKNFYKEHPDVSRMSDQEVEVFRLTQNNIMVKYVDGNNVRPIPKPVLKFHHAFEDYTDILDEIKKQKFKTPSPVQCQTWPIVMSGHDLIAVAQTGTGKTLAFLLPAFIHLDLQSTPRNKRKGPSVLVLAPTRELVMQIESEVKKYSYKGIKSMSIYGGISSEQQKELIQKGVEIVIAAPGRLNEFVCNGTIDLSDVTFLVLDEVDRMLDLGFESLIRVSLLKVRPDRQTIMTSATWPPGVKRLAKSYTTNPVQLIVASLDLTTVSTVKQDVIIMNEEKKELWLDDFLKGCSDADKILIYVNCKVTVDELSTDLSLKGFNVESIHGGREQGDREMALENLRSGEVSILIATDVASRGIDINDITVVINYEFTKDIKEYVHRVGRTGRAGKTGLAITLMTRRDWDMAKDLVEVMEKSGQDVPPELINMARFQAKEEKKRAEKGDRPFRGGGGKGRGRGFSKGDSGFSGNRRNNW